MSAQNELPPGWSVHEVGNCAPEYVAASPRGRVAGLWITGDRDAAVADAWSGFGITREEYATMRAAVERCAELEAALEAALVMVRRAYEIGFGGTYGLDGSPYALAREIEKSGLLSDTPTGGGESEMSETKDNHEPGDCEECPESIWPMCPEHMAIEIGELRVQLAKVTAERDEARSCAAEMRDSLHDAQPSIEEGPSEWMPLTWERATPTEGECSECGATSEERGLLPCDMPGCPRATPTEGA